MLHYIIILYYLFMVYTCLLNCAGVQETVAHLKWSLSKSRSTPRTGDIILDIIYYHKTNLYSEQIRENCSLSWYSGLHSYSKKIKYQEHFYYYFFLFTKLEANLLLTIVTCSRSFM